MGHKWIIIIILIASMAVHFAFFGRPNETVFDEVHFGKFVSGYYTGEYYFDIHPPLGKLIIAGFAKLFDFQPQYSFVSIGDQFPDSKYMVLRFLPSLAGILLPLVIFLLILELGLSRAAALAGALFVIFDNGLLTQSRLILLDPFLLLFGFASLLFYFKYTKNRIPSKGPRPTGLFGLNTKYLILTAIFSGLALSIKWTGLSFIALPLLVETYNQLKEYLTNPTYIKFVRNFLNLAKFASFFIISLAIYFSVFALHFALLPKPGPGDAFMRPGFQQNNMVKNILYLNIEMYKSNQRLSASHPYSSQWYTWPFMTRPIYYWVKDTARIYFLGNPVIWWASAAAVAVGIKYLTLSAKKRKLDKILVILLGGYFLNLLPFIGVKRVMFLYHYLTALIFAILILCYLADKNKNSRKIFMGIVIAAITAFLFFSPLSYGLPLSDEAYKVRVWFASWR
jgi:dolichyl-phosphate-mannose-protein mannosyltransferase